MSQTIDAVLRSEGAAFGRWNDSELPAHFAGLESEWAAVRQGCGIIDARFRGSLRLVGSERITFLQGMISNDVVKLAAGQGTYAAFLTQQGRIVSDLRVYVLPDEVWLDVQVNRVEAVRQGLERYIIADDVEIIEPTDRPLVVVEGPLSARTLLGVIGESVDGLEPFAHRAVAFDGSTVRVAATTHSGESGYIVFGDTQLGAAVWQRCRAAGAAPVGMEALNVLRIEAGIPWNGYDMDESTLISEVGLEAAISYRKGCYLGQEVVERVAARGQVQKKLVGLRFDGDALPPTDTKLCRDGKEVGWTTSSAWSPTQRAVIALGYARREAWEVGTEMQWLRPAGAMNARVVELPFYAARH